MDTNVTSNSNGDKKSATYHMLDEILYLPHAMLNLLTKYLDGKDVACNAFGEKAVAIFSHVHRIQLITTDKSYYVGLMARYWLEEISGIPCQIEKASAYLMRVKVIESNKLCVIISETGEEECVIKAVTTAKDVGYVAILSVCNVVNSTIIRETDFALNTDVGLASNLTQNVTNQLIGLFLLSLALGRYHRLNKHNENFLLKKLELLPEVIQKVLVLNKKIESYSTVLAQKEQVVYLGRDIQFPIAMEGAAKMNELSAMTAIANSPEEFHINPYKLLKSLCQNLPVIALAPSYDFFDQWKASFSNFIKLQYDIFVLSDRKFEEKELTNMKILPMPTVDRFFSPMIYTIPLQLIACHVGLHGAS